MPTPTRPRRLKVIAGTDRPDRRKPELELPVIHGLPEPGEFLDVVGADEFTRVARLLHVAGVLTDGDIGILSAYAATWSRLVRKWGGTITVTAAEINAFRALAGELGLTPASRAKLPPPSSKPKQNAFSNNGKRPA